MAFDSTDLIFVVDVPRGEKDRDVANFELHDGDDLLRKQVITCGRSNPPGPPHTFEGKAFAVKINSVEELNALRNALRTMLNELDTKDDKVAVIEAKREAEQARERADKERQKAEKE